VPAGTSKENELRSGGTAADGTVLRIEPVDGF
jgi:hypothetical protein